MAPLDWNQWPAWAQYAVYGGIGFAFGAILEQAGFGNSRRLAMQFYFRDLTVLKVMFSAIITAMLLIFGAYGLGILDYSQVYVNTTYLWPGVVGGLIMGVGFIIGGFCPGTSLVSAATLKIDGIFFVLGALAGVALFGETVEYFADFWHSSDYGRLTLFDVTGLPPGAVIFAVVLMAVGMFKGGEWLESRYAGHSRARLPIWAVVAYVSAALIVWGIGYPDAQARWRFVMALHEPKLQSKSVFISPAEVLSLHYNDAMDLHIWDLRSEEDFNRFHLVGARHIVLDSLKEERYIRRRARLLPNSLIVLADWNEEKAVEAYRVLAAFRIPNIYILEGGVQSWLAQFAHLHRFEKNEAGSVCPWKVPEFFGDRHPAAEPPEEELKQIRFIPKVRLESSGRRKGGCG